MKLLYKPKIYSHVWLSCFLLLTSLIAYPQVDITSTMQSEITVNGSSGLYEIVVENTTNTSLTNVGLTIALPTGVQYEDNSATASGAFTEVDPDVVSFTIQTIAGNGSFSLQMNLLATCSSIDYQEAGNVFRNAVDVIDGDSTYLHTSNPYNILYPALTILSVSPKNTTIASGATVTRTYTVVNGGNGSASDFVMTHNEKAEIEVLSTSLGVLGADGIVISESDFAGFGNGNTLFDQDEIITFDVTYRGTSCTDKTVSNTVQVGWLGDNEFCQNSTTNINTSIDFNSPSIVLTTEEQLLACYESNTAHSQKVILNNTGDGVASNITLDLFKSMGEGTYDQDLLSKFDPSSIQISVNGGAFSSLSAVSTSSTRIDGDYSCLGESAIGQMLVNVPNMEPGDEVEIIWDMYVCCLSTCGAPALGGWESKIDYLDICGTTNYSSTVVGQEPVSANMTLFTETSPQIMNGEREQFTYVISSYENTFPVSEDSRMRLEFTIPAGLTLTGQADVEWVNSPLSWTASYYDYNSTTGILTVEYPFPETFNLPKSEINLYLTADCAMDGAVAGNNNIELDINFIQDVNCASSCGVPLYCNKILSTELICPDENCATGGFRNTAFTIKRSSFGHSDNDEDGYPDAVNSINTNLIKTNRVMYKDTMNANLSAVFHTSGSFTDLPHATATVEVEGGTNTQALYAVVRVYDNSAGVYYETNLSTITSEVASGNKIYTLEIPSGSIQGGYTFAADDSINVSMYLEQNVNLGGTAEERTCTAWVEAKASENATAYYCRKNYDNITFIGYFFAVWTNENYTIRNCGKTISQEFLFSVGDCCSNFGGGNLFPYEYRNWAEVATAKVVIPTYYTVNYVDLLQYSTKGTNSTFTQKVSSITNDYRNRDTLIFDLSQYYASEGGTLHSSDDGFSGKLEINISPDCRLEINTYQDVYWAFNFNTKKYLGNATTEWFKHTSMDRVRYNPKAISLSSTNPAEDGVTKQVTWNLKTKNPFAGMTIDNPWLHMVSPTGDIQILYVIDKSSGDTLQLSNDLYMIDALTGSENRSFDIVATYTSCSSEDLIVYSGYSCNDIPSSYSDVICPHDNITLSVDPKPAQLQVQIAGATIGDECSAIVEVDLLMQSVRLGAVDSLLVTVLLPDTESILNVEESNYYAYPNTGTQTQFTNPTLSNSSYRVPVHQLSDVVETNGLPGVTQIGENKISLKMRFEMESHFVPGDYLQFQVESKNTCNADLPTINLAFDPNLAFEELTIAGLTTDLSDNWSASWGDYNNDGYDDMFITNYDANEPNSLYTNNGDRTFTKVTTGEIVTDLASSVAASWADYNNDGYLDLFVANNIGHKNFLYKNNGNGSFTKSTSGHMASYDGYSHGATWADYNGDGYLDLFVSDYMPTRVNLLYKNNGDGTFDLNTNPSITGVSGHSIAASWADADGDGDPDLFVPNAGEANFFYLNNGGDLILQSASALVAGELFTTGGSWGDIDNDGDLDLFVANGSATNNQLFVNDGSANFTLQSSEIENTTSDSHGSVFGDFDNDGDLDLFVTNDQAEENEYYINDGAGTYTRILADFTEDLSNSFGTAVADIENDGDLDLFVANHSYQKNNLYLNSKGACSSSMCMSLFSQTGTAVGTKVFVTTTVYGQVVTQMREVTTQTGGGAGGQNSMKLHMGLGDASTIDTIRIEWPSGNIQYLLNQTLTDCFSITEEGGSLVEGIAYIDSNENCIKDENEIVLPNQKILISPLGRHVFTDESGYYSTYLVDGDYTIGGVDKGNFEAICTDLSLNVSGDGNTPYTNQNRGFRAICTSPDLNVNIGTAALRRGFASDVFIEINNVGGATATNTNLKLVLPTGIEMVETSIPYSYEISDTLVWALGDLAPYESIHITIRDTVLLDLQIGDSVTHFAKVEMDNFTDCNSADNEMNYKLEIVGAIDPNDKNIEFLDGTNRNYFIQKETVRYKVRFQNIGSYYASRVTIVDTLNPLLDPNSISNVISSHAYKMTVTGNVITWVFNDIKLPAKENDEPGSHGFVSFEIELKEETEIGLTVSNIAYIKFDFEDWIATNTVKNSIVENHPTTGSKNALLAIHPNPATDYVEINMYDLGGVFHLSKKPIYTTEVAITGVDGKLYLNKVYDATLNKIIDVSVLESGVYHMEVKSSDGSTASKKLMVK